MSKRITVIRLLNLYPKGERNFTWDYLAKYLQNTAAPLLGLTSGRDITHDS